MRWQLHHGCTSPRFLSLWFIDNHAPHTATDSDSARPSLSGCRFDTWRGRTGDSAGMDGWHSIVLQSGTFRHEPQLILKNVTAVKISLKEVRRTQHRAHRSLLPICSFDADKSIPQRTAFTVFGKLVQAYRRRCLIWTPTCYTKCRHNPRPRSQWF